VAKLSPSTARTLNPPRSSIPTFPFANPLNKSHANEEREKKPKLCVLIFDLVCSNCPIITEITLSPLGWKDLQLKYRATGVEQDANVHNNKKNINNFLRFIWRVMVLMMMMIQQIPLEACV
jgi:hypothetical protein